MTNPKRPPHLHFHGEEPTSGLTSPTSGNTPRFFLGPNVLTECDQQILIQTHQGQKVLPHLQCQNVPRGVEDSTRDLHPEDLHKTKHQERRPTGASTRSAFDVLPLRLSVRFIHLSPSGCLKSAPLMRKQVSGVSRTAPCRTGAIKEGDLLISTVCFATTDRSRSRGFKRKL